jgi:Mg/Co/Ni transporter MgtE
VTLVPISLNGLGLQEVSIAYVFSQAGGLPFETGITLALLFRLLVFLASLPGAVFLPMILSKSQGDPEVAAGGPAIDAAGSLE